MDQSLTPIIVALAGLITTFVMSGIKRLYAKIDTLAPAYQQLIVAVISFGVMKLGTLLGVTLPLDPTTWTAELVNSLLVALSALGFHNIKKTNFTE